MERNYSWLFSSKRKFNEARLNLVPDSVKITLENCASILEVHGMTIEKMTITDYGYEVSLRENASLLISILQQIPNVKDLNFKGRGWIINNWPRKIPVLDKLESFTYNFLDSKFGYEFIQLFPINKMKKLRIQGGDWDLLPQFLQRQSEIKELEIYSYDSIGIDNLENIQLKSLKINSDSEVNTSVEVEDNFHRVLQNQQELKILQLPIDTIVPKLTSKLLRILVAMPCLESLDATLDSSIMPIIHELSNLRSLKSLTMDYDGSNKNDIILLTSVRMNCIEEVTFLPVFHEFDNLAILENINANWRNLKHLNVYIGNTGVNFVNEYLKIQSLESLKLGFTFGGEGRKFHFIYNYQQYPNLKKLTIIKVEGIDHFEHLLSALPNLELLCIENSVRLDYSPHTIRSLLTLKKLQDLTITFRIVSKYISLTPQDMLLIKALCKQLKEFKIFFVVQSMASVRDFIHDLQPYDDFIDVSIFRPYEKWIILKNVK